MLERLQKKWGVTAGRLVLILVTFALGGSLTGIIGKRAMGWTGIENPWIYIPVYIVVVTLIWPLMVLLVSVPFGQFRFFTAYLRKMGERMGMGNGKWKMENGELKRDSLQLTVDSLQNETAQVEIRNQKSEILIAIFASGAGSNAQAIIDYFRNHAFIKLALIVCNKPGAGVLNIAEKENVPALLINKEGFFSDSSCVPDLQQKGIDFIVLAGFLWKIPQAIIAAFPRRIINIHPALLPNYGGKGMYGAHVHQCGTCSGGKGVGHYHSLCR